MGAGHDTVIGRGRALGGEGRRADSLERFGLGRARVESRDMFDASREAVWKLSGIRPPIYRF